MIGSWFTAVAPGNGGESARFFLYEPEGKVVKNRAHLDMRVGTGLVGEERMAALEADLRVFLRWCTDQNLDPLAAVRVDIERYVRWLQDVRRYQPSAVSRHLSVVVGYRHGTSSPEPARTSTATPPVHRKPEPSNRSHRAPGHRRGNEKGPNPG